MQVTSVGANPAFKARVESPSPLVNGDWKFITNTPENAQPVQKKESHWLRNTIITIAAIAALTGIFIGVRNTEAVKRVMNSNLGFGSQEGFGNKALWVLGKIGDGAKWLKDVTWGNIAKLWKKAPTEAPKPSTPPLLPPPTTPAA